MLIFFYQTVLVRVTISVIKHHDQTQLGEEGVHFGLFSTALSIKSGQELKQGGNLESGTEAQALEEYCSLAYSSWLAQAALL